MILKFKTAYELDFGFSDPDDTWTDFDSFVVVKGTELKLTPFTKGFRIDNIEVVSDLDPAEMTNPFVERWIVNGLINEGYVEKIAS